MAFCDEQKLTDVALNTSIDRAQNPAQGSAISGRGEMAAMVRAYDWASTPLGPIEQWPQSLRVAVGICLNSRFPMFVWWGPQLINIYNDSYIPMLGKRHPAALGRPAQPTWADIWHIVGPQADAVMLRGEATWNERVLLVMERHGYTEETWFTWSYSPIPDEKGGIGGLFCAVTEDTPRVIAERERDRLAGQKQLALDAAEMGWWHYDPQTRISMWDARYAEIFGVSGRGSHNEEILKLLHPDDRPAVWAKVEAALDPQDPQPFSAEYRVNRRDGSMRWVEAHGLATFAGEGSARKAVSFVGTVADVSERKAVEKEYQQLLGSERLARGEAETANKAKDKFLAVLSHELRTPLSPVLLSVAAMEIDDQLPSKFRDDMAMIRRNIDLETKLIDDLLDLSRITSGKLRLGMQPTSAHDLLRHVVRSSISEMPEKNLSVELQFEAHDDRISADPARLQQVFWNLLRNAVKFSREGGRVVIRTWNDQHSDEFHVEVRDEGEGIDPLILPRIFDAFEQGDARMTRQFGGLGLGLAIAKAVVEMHGGSISAASDGKGHGASFAVRLGRPVPAAAGQRAGPKPRTGEEPQRGSVRILLVEDHPDTARTLSRLLVAMGYQVKVANSAAAALQLAEAESFDMVISDIGLPDSTGHDLMRQLKRLYNLRGVALTGYGMEDDMRNSREAGFLDHVVKPIDIAQLEAVIQRVVGEEPA